MKQPMLQGTRPTGIAPIHPHLALAPFFRIIPRKNVPPPVTWGHEPYTAAIEDLRPHHPDDGETFDMGSDEELRAFTYSHRQEAKEYTVKGIVPQDLSYDDAAIMTTVLAMAADQAEISEPTEDGILAFHPLEIETCRKELLRHLGWRSNINNRNRLTQGLTRLGDARVSYRTKGYASGGITLLEVMEGGATGTRLKIGVNSVSSSAILNPEIHKNAVIADIEEIRQLKTQTTKAIYFALIRIVPPGSERLVGAVRVLENIYNAAITADQRRTFLRAIKDFDLPGWHVSAQWRSVHTHIRVSRPRLRGNPEVLTNQKP